MRELLEKAIKILEEERTQLFKWAQESVKGGWSTHQVGPMEARAHHLQNEINDLKVKMYEL